MLARCARCNGTFTTERYGRQTCPHCGAELILPPPPGTTPEPEPPQAPAPPAGAAPQPPQPPPPPQGGFGPPPGGYGPPPGWGPPPYGPPPGGGGWGPPPPGGPGQPAPFAERARLGFVSAFFETWKLVATQPEQFFGRVRIDQTWTAVLFGVIASTVGNAAAAVYSYLSGKQAMVAIEQMVQKMPEDQAKFFELYSHALTGGALLAQVILAPVLAFIGIYVGAAIVHLLLLLFRGAGRGFDATLTAVAYVTGLNLLLAVPACGSLIAVVWSAVALIIGLAAVQRCGTGRAALAVLAPLALVCVCACAAAGIAIPTLLKGAGEASKVAPPTQL